MKTANSRAVPRVSHTAGFSAVFARAFLTFHAFSLLCLQRELADISGLVDRVPHAGDYPCRLVDLSLVSGHARGPLRRDVSAAVGEGDLEIEDPALNAQPLGAGRGQCVRFAGEGRVQFLRAVAEAGGDAAAAAGLDVVLPSLHVAACVVVCAAPVVMFAVLGGEVVVQRAGRGCATSS